MDANDAGEDEEERKEEELAEKAKDKKKSSPGRKRKIDDKLTRDELHQTQFCGIDASVGSGGDVPPKTGKRRRKKRLKETEDAGKEFKRPSSKKYETNLRDHVIERSDHVTPEPMK